MSAEKPTPSGRPRFPCWRYTILKVCMGGLIFSDQLIQSGTAPDELSIRSAHATNRIAICCRGVPGPFSPAADVYRGICRDGSNSDRNPTSALSPLFPQ